VEHEEHGWCLRQVLKVHGEDVEVGEIFSPKVEGQPSYEEGGDRVALSKTFHVDPSHYNDLDNLAEMDNMHEAPLLDMLRRRHEKDKIYTRTADVLISINPYKRDGPIADLMKILPSKELLEKERRTADQQSAELLTPHVYSLAGRAYALMQRSSEDDPSNQALLCQGESGAGKTEAAKAIMRYLAAISQAVHIHGVGAVETDGAETRGRVVSQVVSQVETCVLQSNPILEAFGNAQTTRNDNSSRFGKFVRIMYTEQGTMLGAVTEHYLLELSRLVTRSKGERNYHIFYQMCCGLDEHVPDIKQELSLRKADEYEAMLDEAKQCTLRKERDSSEFLETLDALGTLGVSTEERDTVLKVCTAVMTFGNMRFKEDNMARSSIVESDGGAALKQLATWLGVKEENMRSNLCQRTVQAARRSSVTVVPLSRKQAEESRNAFAKILYSGLFCWIVSAVNKATANAGDGAPSGIESTVNKRCVSRVLSVCFPCAFRFSLVRCSLPFVLPCRFLCPQLHWHPGHLRL
jgi:myosin-5